MKSTPPYPCVPGKVRGKTCIYEEYNYERLHTSSPLETEICQVYQIAFDLRLACETFKGSNAVCILHHYHKYHSRLVPITLETSVQVDSLQTKGKELMLISCESFQPTR